jgi:hypothetical protein
VAALDAQRRQVAGFKLDTQLIASERLDPGNIIADRQLQSRRRRIYFWL